MNAIGAFAHLVPARDLEADAFKLWRLADTFANAEAHEVQPHMTALIEARDNLNRVIAGMEDV